MSHTPSFNCIPKRGREREGERETYIERQTENKKLRETDLRDSPRDTHREADSQREPNSLFRLYYRTGAKQNLVLEMEFPY